MSVKLTRGLREARVSFVFWVSVWTADVPMEGTMVS